ncbi:MAG: hypothetical protein IPO62_14660 [Saprospiraceae bacterium]|nr:hypothetical protein [Saprospiraceae bacterium]
MDQNPSEIGWVKVSQGQRFNVGLKIDGSIWSWGYNRDMVLGDGTNIDKNYLLKLEMKMIGKILLRILIIQLL